MDTTPKYILMCEKARKWLDKYYMGMPGDLYVRKDDGKVRMVDSNILTDGVLHPDCIPLFRQDQLQEILTPSHYSNATAVMMWLFHYWDSGAESDYGFRRQASVEQNLLCFVMKEKYQKIWQKNEWVKAD